VFLIIGLDGATVDLVEPWARQGLLPNLASLMERGAWGRLQAPMPPVTFPSWTTFMTGVNPGRHGIFDFTRRVDDSYAVRFVNSSFRKAPTLWRMLSDAGKRVCSLGIPGNYPPEPVNGYTLSGFDTPVTVRADASFAFPASLAADVEAVGGFPFADFQEFTIDEGWHRRALDSMRDAIARKTELALRLMERETFDCFMLLFGESDTASHHFWSLHDPDSPRYDAALAESVGDGIRETYIELDRAVGRLVESAQPSQVMIVSDHGFGGVGDRAVRLNRWLEANGYLQWKDRSAWSRLAGAARGAALRMVPERWQAPLFRLRGGKIADAVESGVRFGGIDWQKSRVFSEELNYNPALWLNVRGREPAGTVDPEDYDALCRELSDALLDWKDPTCGRPVVRRVWRRDELFSGEYVRYAPDLILELETIDGYSYMCLPSRGESGPAVEKLAPSSLGGGKLAGMSGSHRRDGIFVLSGEGVESGRYRGATMADLAPTVMALLGFTAVDGQFDGVPLACLGTRGAAPQVDATAWNSDGESYYDEDQEKALQSRLERLGYF